jgi:hypothetical protein
MYIEQEVRELFSQIIDPFQSFISKGVRWVEVFEEIVEFFPTSGKFWKMYIEQEVRELYSQIIDTFQ